MASYGRPSLPFARPQTLKRLQTVITLQKLRGTPNRAGKSYPKATSIASSRRSSLPFARRYTLQTLQTLTPRPHQWLLMGVQACRLPALKRLKPLKPLKPLKLCKRVSERPTAQAKATPRPHQWLLLDGPACRSPGVTRFKPFKRFNILLAWIKRLKPLKPPKTLKTLKTLQKGLGTPNRAGKSYPQATSIASSGRYSLPFARRYTLQTKQFSWHA